MGSQISVQLQSTCLPYSHSTPSVLKENNELNICEEVTPDEENTNQYDSYKQVDSNDRGRSRSPKYIDSSTEHNDSNDRERRRHSSERERYRGDQLSQARYLNAEFQDQLTQKDVEIQQLRDELDHKHREHEQLYFKLEKAEKANERLKTTYDVLREQEIQKVKNDLKANEDREKLVADLRQQLEQKDKTIQNLTEQVSEFDSTIKEAKNDIERLTIDKEALAKIADTSHLESQIKSLQNEVNHYKSLVENERRSRHTVTDAISKKDSHIEELERSNYRLVSEIEAKDNSLLRKQDEISQLNFKLTGLDKENAELNAELRDQSEKIRELETDLAQ